MSKRSSTLPVSRARKIKRPANKHLTHPIKDKRKLNALLRYFSQAYRNAKTDVKREQADRNLMVVVTALNTAFRCEDLLQLRVKDLTGGYIEIKENKTGKIQHFPLNKRFSRDVDAYVRRNGLEPDDYMFRGQKCMEDGKPYWYPINQQRMHQIVSQAAKAVGIKETVGVHGLRKTFGYWYMKNGGNELTLMKMYNHSEFSTTMRYVEWDDKDDTRRAIYIGIKAKKVDAKNESDEFPINPVGIE